MHKLPKHTSRFRLEMSSETVIRSSVSEDAILDLLVGAGLNRVEARSVMDVQPEQSSTTLTRGPQETMMRPCQALPSTAFERSLMTMVEQMSQKLDTLSARIDGRVNGVSPSPTPTVHTVASPIPTPKIRRNWADVLINEVPDYSLPLPWAQEEDPSEEATNQPLMPVSENTAKVLKLAFGRPLANQAHLQARKPYQFPTMEASKCPKLDPVAKQLLQIEAKPTDASLAKLQTLVLDAVAPLVSLVEAAETGSLTAGLAAEAAQCALTLLGNASAQMSRERRRKAIMCLNKKVHPLAEEEDIFEDAAPLLLGKVFETKMKAHLESLKCLSGTTDRVQQPFRQSCPHYFLQGRRWTPLRKPEAISAIPLWEKRKG